MAYATVNDLEARWRTLTDSERAVAQALLDDAAVLVDSYGADVDADAARAVTCSMVRRAMNPMTGDLFGVSQASMSAGGYQQQMTYSNPSGELYLTKQERRMLGFGGGRLGTARPSYGRLETDDD